MRIIVGLARASGAERLIPISRAHVDGVLYHGQASQDFVDWLTAGRRARRRPDHPERRRPRPAPSLAVPRRRRRGRGRSAAGRRLPGAGLPADDDLRAVPGPRTGRALGEDVAWAESNAIVFVNSVLGRADRAVRRLQRHRGGRRRLGPGCRAASTRGAAGRASSSSWTRTPSDWLAEESGVGALGVIVGRLAAGRVAAIVGLPADTTEDALKALGAGAASSGSVAMFHAVGLTPEAPTLEAAVAPDREPDRVRVDVAAIRSALASLATVPDGPIDAVALGTPHFSVGEFGRLREFLADGAGSAPGGADREHVARRPGRDHRARLAGRVRWRRGRSS